MLCLASQLQWLPTTIYPNLLASLGIEGRFKLWAEDPAAAPGRRFAESTRHGPLITIPSRSPHLNGAHHPNLPTSGPGSPAPAAPPPENPPPTPPGGLPATVPNAKPAFETRNARSPYRSFSLKHLDDTRTTYLALLSADGGLTVYENDRVENLAAFTLLDEIPATSSFLPPFTTTALTTADTPTAAAAAAAQTGAGLGRTSRGGGEESSYKVKFDPNPDVCYTALRAGVPSDALGMVVAVADRVRVYRTRDTIRAALGVAAAWKGFYLAAEIAAGVHRGLVRDVAWAPGNVRGYDLLATACQDGWVRVFRLDAVTPPGEGEGQTEEGDDDDGVVVAEWGAGRVKKHGIRRRVDQEETAGGAKASLMASSGIRAGLDQSTTVRGRGLERRTMGLADQVRHVVNEISRLDSHRTPVWRVAFDDDGQILGSVGDDGKLMCYRQKPDGKWAKSTEMSMVKVKIP